MVGQEHIVQTLSNAITNKRLSHAYIFSGPRGTGKTSSARIFAKAVNTFEVEQQMDKLDSSLCQRITDGHCVDIVEIDAASNTGVDNIRDLNEKVNFTPVECHYKFYIIDEVHMLSTGAFNALLKTLEEPPSHTIFILATTEPHKIPPTIHSRCQHLRFRNLSDKEIISQLQFICKSEDITLSENGAAILARNASGCMRDALSLLDQIYSFKGKNILDEDIVSILGTCEISSLHTIIEAIFTKNPDNLLKQLSETLSSGANPLQLIQELIYLTEQVVAHQSNCQHFIHYNHDTIQTLASLSNLKQSISLLSTLAQIESDTRWMSNPSLLLKIRLMQDIQAIEHSTPTQEKPSPTPQKAISKQVPPTLEPKKTPPPSPEIKKPSLQTAPTDKQQTPFEAPKANIETPNNASSTIHIIQTKWTSFLDTVKEKKPGLFTILRQSQAQELQNNTLSIKLHQPIQFFVEKLHEKSYQRELETLLYETFKTSLKFSIENMNQNAQDIDKKSQSEETEPQETSTVETTSKTPSEEPINKIVSFFEGKVL